MENSDADVNADEQTGWKCIVHPGVFFLYVTYLLTTCATVMLGVAFMADHWEEVTWDKNGVDLLANSTVRVQWLLERNVARISTNERDRTIAFLVPMHMGMFTLCFSLSDEEINLLGRVGFPTNQSCVKNLSCELDGVRGYEPIADSQHRMASSLMLCEIVCMLILGSASLIGAFGVYRLRISFVLVAGVMYLLAASFALFMLTVIHFNGPHSRPHMEDSEESTYGVISNTRCKGVKDLLPARVFTTSWSLDLGWGGVTLCVMSSVFWILLSKLLRNNPIFSMTN